MKINVAGKELTIKRDYDFWVRFEGSVTIFEPMNPTAIQFIDSELETEPWQFLGNNLVVDTRFAADLLDGIRSAGLTVHVVV